jgi:hypothetical protein
MEKNKALDAALSQIERSFGKGSIMRMGAKNPMEDVEVISTGSLGLTWPWASAACRRAAWSRSTGRNPRARRRSRCT